MYMVGSPISYIFSRSHLRELPSTMGKTSSSKESKTLIVHIGNGTTSTFAIRGE